ncbi:MAG: ABC transporter permease [Trueperaceae bacterium]|nr:MAG: ABC transporter permease [Trueperaceae bacterium]
MITFALRRLLATVPTLLVVTLLVFGLVRLLPGDPARLMLGESANPQAIAELRTQMGLDRPIMVQYGAWLADVARFDLGRSLVDNASVSRIIGQKLPTTIELSVLSMLVALLLAVPAGTISAVQRGKPLDSAVTIFALTGISMPNFFLGILLIFFFSVQLRWVPASGYVSLMDDPVRNLSLMVLPAITIGVGLGAILTRYLRASLLETLSQDYVRTALAKGVPGLAVIARHALRNAMIPVITAFGLQLGTLLGGAIITEQIFSIPGFGRLLVDAVSTRDLPVIQGVVLVAAMAVFLVSFIVDLLYAAADPRITYT